MASPFFQRAGAEGPLLSPQAAAAVAGASAWPAWCAPSGPAATAAAVGSKYCWRLPCSRGAQLASDGPRPSMSGRILLLMRRGKEGSREAGGCRPLSSRGSAAASACTTTAPVCLSTDITDTAVAASSSGLLRAQPMPAWQRAACVGGRSRGREGGGAAEATIHPSVFHPSPLPLLARLTATFEGVVRAGPPPCLDHPARVRRQLEARWNTAAVEPRPLLQLIGTPRINAGRPPGRTRRDKMIRRALLLAACLALAQAAAERQQDTFPAFLWSDQPYWGDSARVSYQVRRRPPAGAAGARSAAPGARRACHGRPQTSAAAPGPSASPAATPAGVQRPLPHRPRLAVRRPEPGRGRIRPPALPVVGQRAAQAGAAGAGARQGGGPALQPARPARRPAIRAAAAAARTHASATAPQPRR
jgi:hypothetical protein